MSRTWSRAFSDQLFFKQFFFSRTSGNDLNGILALSDRQTDASGTHLGPFPSFCIFFYLGGIIGRPFRHNRLSWRHNRLSWRHNDRYLERLGPPNTDSEYFFHAECTKLRLVKYWHNIHFSHFCHMFLHFFLQFFDEIRLIKLKKDKFSMHNRSVFILSKYFLGQQKVFLDMDLLKEIDFFFQLSLLSPICCDVVVIWPDW